MTRFGFLSTYPPTRCGLATFTEALASAMSVESPDAGVVRVTDGAAFAPHAKFGSRAIVAELVNGDARTVEASIRALKAFDVVIVQHEYGIYGGDDGAEVLTVLEGLTAASIVVLHTVLAAPSDGQRRVLERVGELATAVVVMSDAAHDILKAGYRVEMSKVRVIPHGVPDMSTVGPSRRPGRRVLTWGLIGPGKGLEWGIRAMAEVAPALEPIEYLIVGETHPKVLVSEGEKYRDHLKSVVAELELDDVVRFVDDYLDGDQLAAIVSTADVVLLPYDTRTQVTSGVLVEAIAAGKPVVSTAFPHAVELLAGGAGIVVGHEDPTAIASALDMILGGEGRAEQTSASSRMAAGTSWPEVADQYLRLADRVLASRAA